ncbi:hypothetical protein GCM10011511_46560 [Puia dinghuensis]|uniref:Protochlamydia outer membrane protein domain-containing protein n=1 Tax=Puia dinghuensis TaxID=1792502 RepID=A0A8J2XVL9_9BACT|nr:hypothetical protein GCM10011511_46560 [Puia dinghuensis]
MLLTGQWASGQGVEAVVTGGYHQENLRWSIAGNSAGTNPNIYSELKWRHVGGLAVDAALRYGMGRRWVFFAEGSRVFTSTGRVSDMDYAGNNRTFPLYNQNFNGGNGYSYAFAAGAGYRLWTSGRWRFTPYVGYGVSGQHLTITDPGGLYDFLNSSYQTSWYGPLVRGVVSWTPGGKWEVSGVITYHQVNYRADADWNLISAFSHPLSFRHTADGYGVEGELGVQYRAGRWLTVLLAAKGFTWATGKGIDELYHPDSPSQQTQLNEAALSGFGLRAGVKCRF